MLYTVAHHWDVVKLRWAHACTRACACMRAYLFPFFLWLKIQHTYCVHVCIYVSIYIHLYIYLHIYIVCLFAILSISRVVWLNLCRTIPLGNNRLSVLPTGVFAGLTSLEWVCVFLVAVYRVLCLRESVDCVSLCTYECKWPLFDLTSNACCTCIAPQDCMYKHEDTRTYMYRQTDRHSG
jgi:hypothetical protein